MTRAMDGVRVAVVCEDLHVLEECAAQVRVWGAVAYPRASLSQLAEVAELCAVVVVFADGYDDEAVRGHLDGIERWREGPTLVVVTDRSPPSWNPRLERERPAVVVARLEWTTRLLGLAATPTEPELPFTD
ncbi:MAG TPA: hypothetical protein VF316_17250 [Polyangiaceae bacterium]